MLCHTSTGLLLPGHCSLCDLWSAKAVRAHNFTTVFAFEIKLTGGSNHIHETITVSSVATRCDLYFQSGLLEVDRVCPHVFVFVCGMFVGFVLF